MEIVKEKEEEKEEEVKEEEVKEEEKVNATLEDLSTFGGLDTLGVEETKEDKTKEVDVIKEVEEIEDEEIDEVGEVQDIKKEDIKKEDEEKVEDKKEDWESEDNPYKRRFKDTQAWGNKSNKELLELQEKNKQLSANIDDVRGQIQLDEFKQEPKIDEKSSSNSNDVDSESEFINRIAVSEQAAYSFYGKGNLKEGEKIVKDLIGANTEFHNLLKTDASVRTRFRNAQAPIAEAIQIMEERKKSTFLGSGSIEEMKEKLREEIKMEQVNKKRLKNAPSGTASGRGKSGEVKEKETPKVESLSDLAGLG